MKTFFKPTFVAVIIKKPRLNLPRPLFPKIVHSTNMFWAPIRSKHYRIQWWLQPVVASTLMEFIVVCPVKEKDINLIIMLKNMKNCNCNKYFEGAVHSVMRIYHGGFWPVGALMVHLFNNINWALIATHCEGAGDSKTKAWRQASISSPCSPTYK